MRSSPRWRAGGPPGPASQDRLSIPVTATAAQLQHAFGITLATATGCRAAGRPTPTRSRQAIQQEPVVAPYVTGIVGLNDLYPAHSAARPIAAAAATRGSAATTSTASTTSVAAFRRACRSGTSTVCRAGYPLTQTMAGYYGLSWPGYTAWATRARGAGSRSWSWSGAARRHGRLREVLRHHHQGQLRPRWTAASGAAGSGEAPLDIEMLAALAPQASIDVYQSPNTNAGFYDIFKKFAVADTNRALSVSWGSCEANTALATMKAQESVFEQANAQGQTIFAAAGDEGSTSCFRPSSGQANPKVSALTPASAPFVIGVGGTSFRGTGASQQEIVWNDSNSALGTGAGGGGVSSIWCMPGYQHQTRSPGSSTPIPEGQQVVRQQALPRGPGHRR